MESTELKNLRKQIDTLDKKLVLMLAKRFAVTKKVGEFKAKYHLPAMDSNREKEVFEARKQLAKKYRLDEGLVVKIFEQIIAVVRQNHKKIYNRKLK